MAKYIKLSIIKLLISNNATECIPLIIESAEKEPEIFQDNLLIEVKGEQMMTLDTMAKLSSQQQHMDIIEKALFAAQDQLKTMRLELETIMTDIVKEER